MTARILTACLAAATAALLLSAATAQCPQGNWTLRGGSCYKWFRDPQYWFNAEQTCLSHEGHLVSIGSEQENRLVGRLSHCTHAWIGRFGTDLNRLTDPTTYLWTDGSNAVSFDRHNFSELDSVHKPLIRTDGEWWLNSLYHERHPFVCEQRANSTQQITHRCPSGWSLFQGHCYLVPQFEANFNEANFYCQRNSSQLVSVLSEAELIFINKLTFGIGSCENPLDTTWTGLIKLHPCFPDSGGRELCYQWTDFSGKHLGFPQWEAGHPDGEDWTVNCVTLRGGRLRSDRCHNRHRFVCKLTAVNDTDGGAGPELGVVAAFDFRKGLENLVDADTFPVTDDFGVPRTAEDGACFTFNESNPAMHKPLYRIGTPVHFNESLMTQPEWTLYFRWFLKTHPLDMNFVALAQNTAVNKHEFAALWGIHYGPSQNSTVHRMFVGYRLPRNPISIMNYNDNAVVKTGCAGNWCDVAITMHNSATNVSMNGHFPSWHSSGVRHYPQDLSDLQWQLGFGSEYSAYNTVGRFCVKCFGIAHRQLNSSELEKVFSLYCQ